MLYGIAIVPALKHPEHCEDSYLIDEEIGLTAVFDGIGGAAGGKDSSMAAVRGIKEATDKIKAPNKVEWLKQAVANASRVVDAGKKSFSQGTTATLCLSEKNHVYIVSIGDSRAYKYSQNQLELLTVDDDILDNSESSQSARREVDNAQTVRDLQSLKARQLFSARNHLGDELGSHKQEIEPDTVPIDKNDLLILSSDGLHDNLTHDEIRTIIEQENNKAPQIIAESLCRAARQRSTESVIRAKDDDITVLVVKND